MRVGKQAGTGNATARPARRDARRDEERDEAIGHGAVSKQEHPSRDVERMRGEQ